MADINALLNRWQSAGVLDAEGVGRIRAYEQEQERPGGLRWQGITALILGAILLGCGVVLFVSAHWDQLGPGERFALVMAMVAVFHVTGGLARENSSALSTALHAVGTVATGAAIALTGQIFNIQEHWPAAVLMWALAALAGWALLRDQAQQTLALLLVPAWMISELSFYTDGHIGDDVYAGRFLFVWAILYFTFFTGSRRKAVQGILFGAAAIGAVWGTAYMLESWTCWSGNQTFVPFSTRVWCWVAIAAVPLAIAAFHGHKGLIPPTVAVAFSVALPWCYRSWTETERWVNEPAHVVTRTDPNLAAHALVAAFAVFLCWWGVRLGSKMLVNVGIVGFAVAVGWFYFSDIFDMMGRSLGLIGLGILFLAGGWALENMRRRILKRMGAAGDSGQMAAEEAR
jgi:uncharacterized membrane protein